MLQLRRSDIRGVAGDVGQDEVTVLGFCFHDVSCRGQAATGTRTETSASRRAISLATRGSIAARTSATLIIFKNGLARRRLSHAGIGSLALKLVARRVRLPSGEGARWQVRYTYTERSKISTVKYSNGLQSRTVSTATYLPWMQWLRAPAVTRPPGRSTSMIL